MHLALATDSGTIRIPRRSFEDHGWFYLLPIKTDGIVPLGVKSGNLSIVESPLVFQIELLQQLLLALLKKTREQFKEQLGRENGRWACRLPYHHRLGLSHSATSLQRYCESRAREPETCLLILLPMLFATVDSFPL